MNRHQKQKSREIKDIMRADKWERTSYKVAKRKWKSGIRAFPIGPDQRWIAFPVGQLGYNRERLLELGQAVYILMRYATSKNMTFTVEYCPSTGSYWLGFRGKDISGTPFGYTQQVSVWTLRQYLLPMQNFAHYIKRCIDDEIEKLGVTPAPCRHVGGFVHTRPIEKTISLIGTEDLWPRIIIPDDPHALKPIEPMLGGFTLRR